MTAAVAFRLRRVSIATCLLLAACNRSAPPPVDAPVPNAEAAPQGAGMARISEKAARAAGIVVNSAGPATIHETLPLYGVVKANAEHQREVIARFPGTIRSVTKAVGDRVRQGEALALVESNDSLQTYAVTAPINGVITARAADPGEQTGSDVLFSITDPSMVWVELNLFPSDVARVHVGQTVQIESVAGSLRGSGRISLIGAFGPNSDPAPALTARLPLANSEGRWAPGLFVNGAVELSKTEVPLAVVDGALQNLDGRTVVFVPMAGGYQPRTIKIGRRDGAYVEVLDGLNVGETYVAANSFVIKAELGKSLLEEDEASDQAPQPAAESPDEKDAPEPRR